MKKIETKDYTVAHDGSWINGRPRKRGDTVAMLPEEAKYMLLNGQLVEGPLPAKKGEAPNPPDLDGDGSSGGSRPAEALAPGTDAAKLAAEAEDGDIDFNTLRVAARDVLGDDMPSKKADIIAALRAKATESAE